MVLAGILLQSLSSSLVGFDLSIISRIRLLKVRLSAGFCPGEVFCKAPVLVDIPVGGDSHVNFKFNP